MMAGEQGVKRTALQLPDRAVLMGIVMLAVVARVAVAVYLGDSTPPGKDETSYSTLAARLATGHGYSFPTGWYPFAPANAPTSHWSFLYTGFAAEVYALLGAHPLAVRVVQAVVTGILMPLLTYRLTRRLMNEGGARAIPLLAAGLAGGYAYFIIYGAMVQTEGLYICAVLWVLERGLAFVRGPSTPLRSAQDAATPLPSAQDAATTRRSAQDAIWLGLALGVATLLRQSILPWVAVMFGWMVLTGLREQPAKASAPTIDEREQPAKASAPSFLAPTLLAPSFLRGAAMLVVAGLILVACIAPFTVRNYLAYDGEFLLLNSNAGYAMYSAQHPGHGTSFREYWAAPLPEDLAGKGLNEAQWDRELTRRGIGFVLAEPGRYLLLSLSRVRDYFEFWPTADSSLLFNVGRLVSFTVLLPFMVAGVILALRGSTFERRATHFLALFIVFYSVLHILTWAMSRYRLPVDAAALPFAALALWTVVERVRARKARGGAARGGETRGGETPPVQGQRHKI